MLVAISLSNADSLRGGDWRAFGSMWLHKKGIGGRSNEWSDSIGFPVSISSSSDDQVQIVVAGSPRIGERSRTVREHQTAAESLLDLYLSDGVSMMDKIQGAFACVIADGRDGSVYLARDLFGFVPLFHRFENGILFCSTSLRSLIEASPVGPALNQVGLLRYYLFRYVAPPMTIYKDVDQVAPGCCIVVNEGRVTARRKMLLPKGERREQDPELVREAVLSAVREQAIGDARLGVALSGGLDSAIVAASLPRDDGRRIQAFTLKPRRPAPERETDDALISLCHRKGLDLSAFEFDTRDFALLPEFLYALQEPVCVFPLFYLFLLLRNASGLTDRILLGEGGDELFLGYRHQTQLLESFIVRQLEPGNHNGSLRKATLGVRLAVLEETLGWKPAEKLVAEALACVPGEPPDPDINAFLDAVVEHELTCYPYFFAGARLGAFFGIDVRCPLLHADVISAAFSLGWEALVTEKARDGLTKPVLRNAFKGEVPGEILARPKEGFGETWNEHRRLAREFAPYARVALERLEAAGIPIDKDAVAPAEHLEGESLDLFWHNVYLGIWFESTTPARAQQLGDSLRVALAESTL